MATNSSSVDDLDSLPPAMTFQSLLLMLLAVVIGAFAGVVVLPQWLPGLSDSLLGPSPKAYWYLSRASGVVAYGLLWLSMIFGLTLTNKMARVWPGGPTMFDLHQHASLLGLAFALFHGLILMGDHYINYSLAQVLVPFSSAGYRPIWVGLGQVGFYLMGLVGLSFYARKAMGNRLWRLIHFLSFGMFLLALAHGMMSGTDSAADPVKLMYWITGGSVVFLTLQRVLVTMKFKPVRAQEAAKE
ncbi:MAG: ferric reductase-like transmembrane domain-containing protein [Chloroflexi bacterium]|nr:ferric reductase-like transmembrane domain-containing protein [Chloroflexota bacterium]